MAVKRSEWIGEDGAAFERVGLAFQALGFVAPRGDNDATGGYALNIANQYEADLSEAGALAIIAYGLEHSRAELQAWVRDAGTRNGLQLQDVCS